MNSTEIASLYANIISGPQSGQDQRDYITESCNHIATVTAWTMADTINHLDRSSLIARTLYATGNKYIEPIISQADDANGSFKSVLSDPNRRTGFTTYVAKVSLLNRPELPGVLSAAKLELVQSASQVLQSLPFRLIEVMASSVMEEDISPAHSPHHFVDTAMAKIETYGNGYITRFFGTYLRMLASNNDVESPSRDALDAGKLAIQLANMTWQMRQVVRHIFDLTEKGESTRLENYQFAPFRGMLSNTYERNQKESNERGQAAVEVALIQDIIECV